MKFSIGLFLVAGFLAMGTSDVSATPCDTDFEQLCADMQPGMGTITGCLRNKQNQVSFECREWINRNRAGLDRLASSCDTGAREFCRDEKTGYGRVYNCMMRNFDKLSSSCQRAIQDFGK